jgi:hypothetical protein
MGIAYVNDVQMMAAEFDGILIWTIYLKMG